MPGTPAKLPLTAKGRFSSLPPPDEHFGPKPLDPIGIIQGGQRDPAVIVVQGLVQGFVPGKGEKCFAVFRAKTRREIKQKGDRGALIKVRECKLFHSIYPFRRFTVN